MAVGPPPRRTEFRNARKVLVELVSFENVTYELAYTINVSSYGARVVTKNPWQSNQRLSLRSIQGSVYSQARVAYCLPLDERSFAIGVELRHPTTGWPGPPNDSA